MIQLGFRNHTYSPQVQCTDNKATESPTSKMRGEGRGGPTEEQNGEKGKLQNERIHKVGQWPVRDVGDWYSLDWQGSQWLFPQVAADSAIGSCAIRWNPNTRASACIWWWEVLQAAIDCCLPGFFKPLDKAMLNSLWCTNLDSHLDPLRIFEHSDTKAEWQNVAN